MSQATAIITTSTTQRKNKMTTLELIESNTGIATTKNMPFSYYEYENVTFWGYMELPNGEIGLVIEQDWCY